MDSVNDTNTDDLMNHFRGRSLKSILIFTLIVHIVVIGGTSIPYLVEKFTGPNKEKMSEEERTKIAVKEATAALQKIAEEHGLQPQQLSDQFKGGSRPKAEPKDTEPAPAEATPKPKPDQDGKEKSQYEKDLEKTAPAPELPPIDQADDLFKSN